MKKNKSMLHPNLLNLFNSVDMIQNSFKFICLLERPFEKDRDYLIAGHFTNNDGFTFGYPFVMVENK